MTRLDHCADKPSFTCAERVKLPCPCRHCRNWEKAYRAGHRDATMEFAGAMIGAIFEK